MITEDEITKVKDCVEQSEDIKANAFGRADANGRTSRLCLWNRAGNDVTGVLARYGLNNLKTRLIPKYLGSLLESKKWLEQCNNSWEEMKYITTIPR